MYLWIRRAFNCHLTGQAHTPDVFPSVNLLPTFNTMAMFVVEPGKSFHSVQASQVSLVIFSLVVCTVFILPDSAPLSLPPLSLRPICSISRKSCAPTSLV